MPDQKILEGTVENEGSVSIPGAAAELRGSENERPEFSAALFKVFSPLGVAIFAILGLVLFISMSCLSIFSPETMNPTLARLGWSLLLSFGLSVFMFCLYPVEVALSKVPILDLGVKITGPLAIYLISFAVLQTVPVDKGRAFFFQFPQGVEGQSMASLTFQPGLDIARFGYILSGESDVLGIYVECSPGASACGGVLASASLGKSQQLNFQMNKSNGTMEVFK